MEEVGWSVCVCHFVSVGMRVCISKLKFGISSVSVCIYLYINILPLVVSECERLRETLCVYVYVFVCLFTLVKVTGTVP